MVFASQAFLAFLVVVLGVYWALSKRYHQAGKGWIIAASLFFYGYWAPVYVLLLAISMVVNFALVRAILATTDDGRRSLFLTIGVVLNIGLIAYFKYFAFLVESVNDVAALDLRVPEIILPIGISFLTFQQIGLLVDARQGRVARLRFWDHLFLISFFPHLIAGPILSQHELLPQLAAIRRWILEPGKLAVGAALFAAWLPGRGGRSWVEVSHVVLPVLVWACLRFDARIVSLLLALAGVTDPVLRARPPGDSSASRTVTPCPPRTKRCAQGTPAR